MSKFKLTEIAEMASVVATIPALIYNQAAVACIPVSIAFALNIFNRKNLIAQTEQLVQNQQSNLQAELAAYTQQNTNLPTEVAQLQLSVSQLTKDSSEMRSQLGTQLDNLAKSVANFQEFTLQYPQDREQVQQAIAQVEGRQSHNSAEILEFQEQLTVAQKLNAELFKVAQQWYIQHQSWEAEKAEMINKMDECVFKITHTTNPNHCSFYESGLKHSQNQEWQAALDNYNQAIQIAPDYAEAYRDRGLVKMSLADKQGAAFDLRKAAQLFFDRGDIENYHQTKDLTKNLHEFSSIESTENLRELEQPTTVQNLFS